jgi:isopentenyl-diphosphate delta-isomerase
MPLPSDGSNGGEQVVLVTDRGVPIGTADKNTVHNRITPLHLAFSCHVFDSGGRVLMTRRALTKATWPGVWTNAFCGHPMPEESFEAAIRRRAADELSLSLARIASVLPDFRYQATDANGVMENEVCPVFSAETVQNPIANPAEVCDWRWVEPEQLLLAVGSAPFAFSPWLVLQLDQWRYGQYRPSR